MQELWMLLSPERPRSKILAGNQLCSVRPDAYAAQTAAMKEQNGKIFNEGESGMENMRNATIHHVSEPLLDCLWAVHAARTIKAHQHEGSGNKKQGKG